MWSPHQEAVQHRATKLMVGNRVSYKQGLNKTKTVGRVTVDLIRRSWVRFPPRSKDFFFASCGSLFPFTRANAQWVIHGFKVAL